MLSERFKLLLDFFDEVIQQDLNVVRQEAVYISFGFLPPQFSEHVRSITNPWVQWGLHLLVYLCWNFGVHIVFAVV